MPRRRSLVGALAVAAAIFILALALLHPGVTTGAAVGDDALTTRLWPLFTSGAPAPATRNPFLYDATYVFHPDLEWARDRVRSLTPPIWNPYISAGVPQLASQQTSILFPLTWLAFVLPFWWSLGLILALKIVLGAVGVFLFGRAIGLRTGPALLSAVAYSFGAYYVAWLSAPHTSVYALLPWMLLGADAVVRRGRARDVGLLAAATTLALLGGHPQSALICGLLVVGYSLWLLWAERSPDAAPARRRAVRLVAGLALGLLGAAVVLIPFAEALQNALDTSRSQGHGSPLRFIATLGLPEAWGRPDRAYHDTTASNYLERTTYVGVLPLILAGAAVLRWRPGPTRFFAVAALIAAAFAYEVPWLTHQLQSLPVVDRVAMTRACILLAFCVAMLAGLGLQLLLDGDGRMRRVTLAVAVAAILLPVAVALIREPIRAELSHLPSIMPLFGGQPAGAYTAQAASVARWILFALVSGALLLGVRRAGPRAAVALAVAAVALTAFDLVNLNRGFFPTFDAAATVELPAAPPVSTLHDASGHDRVAVGQNGVIPNVNERYLLRDVRGHGLPEISRVARLYRALGGAGEHAKQIYPNPDTGKLLGTFGAIWLLASPPPPEIEGIHPAPAPYTGQFLAVDAVPRAFVATDWRSAPDQASALRETVASSVDELGTQPIIEGAPAAPAAGGTPREARFLEDHDVDVRVAVDAPGGGWLVLLDSFYPGWHASVDGKDAEIHPANSAFRAVRLPPGAREVAFAYRPASIIGGALLSVLACAVIAALLIGRPLRRRR